MIATPLRIAGIIIILGLIAGGLSWQGARSENLEETLLTQDNILIVGEENIRINEVMFYPEEGEYEWVELKNVGEIPVKLGGWSLTDVDRMGFPTKNIRTSTYFFKPILSNLETGFASEQHYQNFTLSAVAAVGFTSPKF